MRRSSCLNSSRKLKKVKIIIYKQLIRAKIDDYKVSTVHLFLHQSIFSVMTNLLLK